VIYLQDSLDLGVPYLEGNTNNIPRIKTNLDRLVFQMATWSINQYFQTVSILFIDQHSAISFFVCGIDHHTA
jgi:phosphoribosylaminoimidazole (AIR) synthetase